jgi:hypothetical protein
MEFNSDFKYDLKIGQEGEKRAAQIFQTPIEKIEVKNDQKTIKTGNIYIEYESRGKKSGIATTEAEIIIIMIEGSAGGLFFYTEELKKILRPLIKTHTVRGGDSNTSKGILINVTELLRLRVK